ncbi:MAG: hypothetical protein HYX60_03330 [Legionella longbeachae]|nr:hypothetical protein [Legionella longbeachae]
MSQFPYKTQSELRGYFKRHNLMDLMEINRSYGPYFTSLEGRIDNYNHTLVDENLKLKNLKMKKEQHEQGYDKATKQEEEFKSTSESLLGISSRTELFLIRQSLGYSPMDTYNSILINLEERIFRTNTTIENLNKALNDLNQRKKGAISELRLLNHVIEEKKAPQNAPIHQIYMK